MILGYKRVSTVEQNTSRQLDGMTIDKTFEDRCSGKDTNRPELQRMLDVMRSGDTIIVHDISRLARNLTDLLRLIERINGAGIKLKFVKEAITYDSNDKNQKLMLSIMGAVAAFERDMIRERQAEGIAIAKVKGVYKNRRQSKAVDVDGIKDALLEVCLLEKQLRDLMSHLAQLVGLRRLFSSSCLVCNKLKTSWEFSLLGCT